MSMQHIERQLGELGDNDLAKIIDDAHEVFRKRHPGLSDIALPSIASPVEKPTLKSPETALLIATEKQALSAFFGKDIAVSEPPQELFQTLDAMSKLGITGFEPHFLPQVSLTEDVEISGWKVKPESWFWKQIKDGNISADAATLKAGWYLVDGRKKPNYDNGQQRYENDYAEPIMADLRKTGKIQEYSRVPDISRYGASPSEVKQVIFPEFVRIIGIKGDVASKRYIELNVWGNMFHPEWGETDTAEWFADKFGDEGWLYGGGSDDGGLSDIRGPWFNSQFDNIAFSPVIRFSSGSR